MNLRKLVFSTLRENSLNTGLTDQVTSSLLIADYPQNVNEKNVLKVKSVIKKYAAGITAVANPLKATASLNSNAAPRCPYCHKEMVKVSISGDLVKEAYFCSEDRITLPRTK